MKDLKNDIVLAIEKNLSSQMSKVLLSRFEELESIERQAGFLEKDRKADKEIIASLRNSNVELTALKIASDELKIDQDIFYLDKLKFEVEKKLLEAEVKSYKQQVDLINNYTGLLVKNPEAVTSMFTNYDNTQHYRTDGSIDTERRSANTIITKSKNK